MEILAQFLLRLAFGLAVGMAITSSQQVSSGFFRNHLYVTMGLATLAALVAAGNSSMMVWFAGVAAVLSYVGSACWLYDAKRLGQWVVWLVASMSLLAAWVGVVIERLTIGTDSPVEVVAPSGELLVKLVLFSIVSSGLVLGITTAAMLLGHWYLNSPDMKLEPLRRLLAASAIAVVVQMLVSGVGLTAMHFSGVAIPPSWWLFLVLRWSFGLFGVLALLWMAWRTLDIPNTQSATGILYVAVIGVFVGELTAALLSAESTFPL